MSIAAILAAKKLESEVHLISAAPELLEALGAVLRCLQWHISQHGTVAMDDVAISKAIAAIQKARGES